MKHKKIGKYAIGTGLVLSFGLCGHYMSSSSTTMGTETELAGMAYTLDQYCTMQVGAGQSDPEAIVAFEDTSNTQGSNSTVSGSAVGGATPQPTTSATATATPKPESEYANVGISIAADYVNIRKKPNTEAEIVGKLYRGSAATISSTEGDWVYIRSGSVSGYIMKDYLAIGYSAEKLIDDFGTKWATVTTETLRVREEKSETCKILTLLPEDETYEVLREETDWVKIRVDGDTTGYVAKPYVKISVQFKKAVSNLRFYGKMSLTNYISQSILGAIIYFPFGFYLAPYCGYSISLLIGIILLILQVQFCKWWLSKHKQGPLETIWHKWTWIGSKK